MKAFVHHLSRQISRNALYLTLVALPLGSPAIIHAQEEDDRPEEEGQQVEPKPEQEMLADFGSGLRAFAALLDDTEIDIDELKELYQTAQDALNPDYDMLIYVDGYEDNQQQQELAGFQNQLKELVYNGSMSRDEVLGTWLEVIDVPFFHKFEKDDVDWSDRMLDADRTGNLAPIRLRIPEAGDVRILVRPEFLMRDLKFFGQELELDEATLAIIETLLRDYVETYERRSAELKDAIREARRSGGRESMLAKATKASNTLGRVDETIDWSELQDRVDERVGGERRQEWMRNAVVRMEGSLLGIRKAIDQRRLELGRQTGGPTDSKQVIKLAADLQSDRRSMREKLTESMKLVLDEPQQEALERVFEKFTLEQGRIDAKLGGSRINLELALLEALDQESMSEEIRESLEKTNAEILQLIERWSNARMDRERSGLELFVAYQSDESTDIDQLTTSFGQRAITELTAALAIRNQLMAGQSELEAKIAESKPELARRFSEVATEQGFRTQMRPRWCEQALIWAVACPELGEKQSAALAEYSSELSAQLQPARMQAIQLRLVDEPRIARAKIDQILGRKSTAPIGLSSWREPGAERFLALNEQVESQLEAVLAGMNCLNDMPRRRGNPMSSEERAERRRERAAVEQTEQGNQEKSDRDDKRENRR
jgi:hypothetical protein